MSCPCKKCLPPKAPLNVQEYKSLSIGTSAVTPVCPPGYHWDGSKCAKDVPATHPDTWDCTMTGCVKRTDGSGHYTSLSDCQNHCIQITNSLCDNPPTVTIDPADGTVVVFPSYIFMQSSRNDAQIYYTLDGSLPTTASTLYTGPFLLNSNPTTIKARAIVQTCDYGSLSQVTYDTDATLEFEFICADEDKVGDFGVFVPNGSPDYNWHLKFTTTGMDLDRLEIYETDSRGVWITGQAWSTQEFINPDEGPANFHVFPLVVLDDGNLPIEPNAAYSYDNLLNLTYSNNYSASFGVLGSYTFLWTLVGQPVKPLSAGYFKLRMYLTDGTVISKVIPAICVSSAQSVENSEAFFEENEIITLGSNPSIISAPAKSTGIVTVTFRNFAYSPQNDELSPAVQLLLVSPSGVRVILWNSSNASNSPSGFFVQVNGFSSVTHRTIFHDLVFDDSASAYIPSDTLGAAPYLFESINPVKPTQYRTVSDVPGAPVGPYNTFLSAFNGVEAAGDWKVYSYAPTGSGVSPNTRLSWSSIRLDFQ